MDIVKRIRTNPSIIAYGLYLYFNSRSYRFASKSLEPITKRTHVSIWKWVQKYASLTDRFVIGGRRIKDVFVDETLLKINGENYPYIKGENYLCVLPVFQANKDKVWKQTYYLH